jgi:hypothetical protein
MLTINNIDKLKNKSYGDLYIIDISEYKDEYRIYVEYGLVLNKRDVSISINRFKRTDVDPKFPLDKTPIYNTSIIEYLDNGGTKRKDLGIKKKALESSDNMIKALNEMLDDFVKER